MNIIIMSLLHLDHFNSLFTACACVRVRFCAHATTCETVLKEGYNYAGV